MIKKALLFIFLWLLVLVSLFGDASAQSGKEAEGKAAEQAGRLREAVTHYVAALQSVSESSTDDQRLRETIINLVQKLRSPPAIPEEARRFSVRGQTWIKDANTMSDFEEAAKEFARALRVAPWWADGYVNQGVALEKAGQFSEAIRSLKLYLLAAPAAPDADKVKDQIYALEVSQERAGKEAVAKREEQERKRRDEEERTARTRQIAGDWYDNTNPMQDGTTRYQVTVTGNNIEIRPTWSNWAGSWHPWKCDCGTPVWRGTIEGLTITGTYYGDNSNWSGGASYTRPMSGSISQDGRTLRLQYKAISPAGGSVYPRLVTGWREIDQERVLWR